MPPAFDFVQMLYWLSLSTWFGGVLFIAIAAQVIFRTVRENNPLLPTVLSVNLEGQHGTLLAGSIVADLLKVLGKIELICGGGLLLALIAQWVIIDPSRFWLLHLSRSALFVGAVAILFYDRQIIEPQVWKYRQEYIDHADEPDLANPAKEKFDRYHRESVTLLTLMLGLLLGMVLLSAGLAPTHTITIH